MSEDTGTVDISEPLREIAHRLGLDYDFIKQFTIAPMHVTATVYEKNADGSKFTIDEMHGAALNELSFKVRT